jgi:hypothetical protein
MPPSGLLAFIIIDIVIRAVKVVGVGDSVGKPSTTIQGLVFLLFKGWALSEGFGMR